MRSSVFKHILQNMLSPVRLLSLYELPCTSLGAVLGDVPHSLLCLGLGYAAPHTHKYHSAPRESMYQSQFHWVQAANGIIGPNFKIS